MTPKQAEEILKEYTHNLNSGKEYPGTPSDDVGTAKAVLEQAGIEVRQDFQGGKQTLWIDGVRVV